MRSRRVKKSHMPRALPRRRAPVTSSQLGVGQPHDHLPGVAAAQEVEEGRDGVLQPLPHGLADDELAGAQPARTPSR